MSKNLPEPEIDFASVFMDAPDPYLLLRPDAPHFTILGANAAYARVNCSESKELAGRPLFEVLPFNRDTGTVFGERMLRESLDYVVREGKAHDMAPQQYDLLVPTETGTAPEKRSWKVRNSPVFAADGSLRCIVHRVEDVTWQRARERDRKRFADVTSDMLVKVGFDGFFREVNSSAREILGWDEAELKSKPWVDLVHPADVDPTLQVMTRVLAGEVTSQFENRYRRRDGSYRWLSWNTLTVPGERLIYCAASDVTASRRLREVTRGQKQALELAVHGAPLPDILERLAITMQDNAGSGVRASILLLSEDGQHLHTGAAPGLPAAYNAAIHGMRIGVGQGSCGTVAATGEMYIADDLASDPYWVNFRALAIHHGLRACWSIPILSSTGQVFGTFALYYSTPRRPEANELQLVEIISRTAGIVIERERNLSAKRRFEADLIQARNAAEAANVAKTDFLANMSHEIRTPMNVIVGITDLLLHHENLTAPQGELVATLQNSADALLQLINNLLDISKIEADSIELQRVPFNFADLLGEVEDMMRIRARQKGVNFIATVRGGCQDRLLGDPARLRQVILNLCSNALKFTPAGHVKLDLHCATPAGEDNARITLTVSDTGIGIDPSKVESIFQKFTQADSSINRKFGGTGLGLSITKRLVEEMGGTIAVESTPGAGSTFTISLPLPLDKSAAAGRPDGDPDDAGSEIGAIPEELPVSRILLVEDFMPNAIIAGRYLRKFGYVYDVAVDGLDAVKQATHCHYAAILMDVQMPELDGFKATRRIRAHERDSGAARTPIVAMTAHAMAGDRERCLANDMDDYIPKPFNAVELKEKLHRLIK